ncbi:Anti-sigma regulatory factor (Ser/Thr protein kinase) [Lentzea xinjiangensis]|uniref:Anti-sigma regulatory factor (Ser/Thr protein kinase) n=1 Tax=Lentzea xinjiangensis TaxID=402600 RepID=A0A1H9JVY9_9PSEU|nr:ATP-binding protein [Lentzea xinjiangensis]SEQ90903.1 Anti-sigma regulatory factor (Ser/Thr protein kinase) [Lentzea xinjiangensis]
MTIGDDPPDSPPELELNRDVPDIAEVRRWTRRVLSHLHEDDLMDVQLVVTELVSNVYDHGLFPARLRLHPPDGQALDGQAPARQASGRVKVTVEDSSFTHPKLGPSSPHTARGRGLVLVDQLSEEWGVTTHAEGKTVWAVVPCTGT